jgi:hypothetical protein
MDKKESSTSGRSETMPKASNVDLVDFSSALSAGLLRAIDARSKVDQDMGRLHHRSGRAVWPNWSLGSRRTGRAGRRPVAADAFGDRKWGPKRARGHAAPMR